MILMMNIISEARTKPIIRSNSRSNYRRYQEIKMRMRNAKTQFRLNTEMIFRYIAT